MDKKEYKTGIKKLKKEQKESKKKYKSERTPKKEVIKAAISKTGKKIFHTREELRKMKIKFKILIDSLKVLGATGTDEDVSEEIKSIVENIDNV